MAPRPHLVGEHSVDPGEVPPNAEQDDLYVGGERSQEPNSNGTIVAKIGGSTLGEHDTTLKDIVELQKRGAQAVVVHGGGKVITEWMARGGVRPKFVRGLRVTDPAVLEIVVAVLTGDDLAADGIGGLICGWMVTDKNGDPMKAPPHPALAQGTVDDVVPHADHA